MKVKDAQFWHCDLLCVLGGVGLWTSSPPSSMSRRQYNADIHVQTSQPGH